MTHRMTETADAVVLAPATPASASVIWLHGLGADGHDFVPIVPELKLPADAGHPLRVPARAGAAGDAQHGHAHARLVRHQDADGGGPRG